MVARRVVVAGVSVPVGALVDVGAGTIAVPAPLYTSERPSACQHQSSTSVESPHQCSEPALRAFEKAGGTGGCTVAGVAGAAEGQVVVEARRVRVAVVRVRLVAALVWPGAHNGRESVIITDVATRTECVPGLEVLRPVAAQGPDRSQSLSRLCLRCKDPRIHPLLYQVQSPRSPPKTHFRHLPHKLLVGGEAAAPIVLLLPQHDATSADNVITEKGTGRVDQRSVLIEHRRAAIIAGAVRIPLARDRNVMPQTVRELPSRRDALSRSPQSPETQTRLSVIEFIVPDRDRIVPSINLLVTEKRDSGSSSHSVKKLQWDLDPQLNGEAAGPKIG